MAAKQLCYPANKCHYTKLELNYLALCLGYPSDFFTSLLHSDLETAVYMITDINVLLEKASLKQKLNNNFNRYDDTYNIKTIKRAMCLLRHKKMTFDEISTARIAFELHSCENGSGMLAEVSVVMEALKMMERVISPTRLDAEIQKQQHYCDFPTRIQMYEFFCLVVYCEKADEVEKSIDTISLPDSNKDTSCNSDLALPDFNRLLMTTNQKILDHLETNYKQSLYKKVTPMPSPAGSEQTISASAKRREQVSTAREQFRCFTPSLELSQLQLHQARNGIQVLTGEQYKTAQRQCTPFWRVRSSTSHAAPLKLQFRRTPVTVTNRSSGQQSMRRAPSSTYSQPRSMESISLLSPRESHQVDSDQPHVQSHFTSGQHTHIRASSEVGRCFEPLVTKQDILRYEGKIRELEWITMRRKTRQLQGGKDARSISNLRSTSQFDEARVQSSTSRCRSKSETCMLKHKRKDSRPLPIVMSFSELPIFKTILQQKQCKTASHVQAC